jgi:competence protein ComEA
MRRFPLVLSLLLMLLVVSSPASAMAQEKAARPKPAETPAVTTPLNLNTATAAQLEKLPGVGARTAQLIVEHRQKNGGFKKVEENPHLL